MEAIKIIYGMIIRFLATRVTGLNNYLKTQKTLLLFSEIKYFIEGGKPRDFVSNAQIVARG